MWSGCNNSLSFFQKGGHWHQTAVQYWWNVNCLKTSQSSSYLVRDMPEISRDLLRRNCYYLLSRRFYVEIPKKNLILSRGNAPVERTFFRNNELRVRKSVKIIPSCPMISQRWSAGIRWYWKLTKPIKIYFKIKKF